MKSPLDMNENIPRNAHMSREYQFGFVLSLLAIIIVGVMILWEPRESEATSGFPTISDTGNLVATLVSKVQEPARVEVASVPNSKVKANIAEGYKRVEQLKTKAMFEDDSGTMFSMYKYSDFLDHGGEAFFPNPANLATFLGGAQVLEPLNVSGESGYSGWLLRDKEVQNQFSTYMQLGLLRYTLNVADAFDKDLALHQRLDSAAPFIFSMDFHPNFWNAVIDLSTEVDHNEIRYVGSIPVREWLRAQIDFVQDIEEKRLRKLLYEVSGGNLCEPNN